MNASTFNTPRTIHESVHTSTALNVDPTTGAKTQVLRTSTMRMRFVGSELAIRFGAKTVDLQAPRREMRPRRLL